MDIRIEKTERAIKQAFMELRARKPLEKIKVKELCDAAEINKSTFYAHYQDVFALSAAMEAELLANVMAALPAEQGAVKVHLHADVLAKQLFRAFSKNKQAVSVLFSGTRQGVFINGVENALRRRVEQADPAYWDDPVRCILLSFCVQGSYYAFMNNSAQMDEETLVALLAAIARAAQNLTPPPAGA